MRIFFYLFAVLVFLSDCSSNDEDRERHNMKDGTIIYTSREVAYYATSEDFREIVLSENAKAPNARDEIIWSKDSLYGYDGEIKCDRWEKVKFGEWISDYGLDKSYTYLVSTLTVSKFLPATYEDWLQRGPYYESDEDSIGTSTDLHKPGFILETSISSGYFRAYTQIKCISYNLDGDKIGRYFPIKPDSLKWKFFKTKSIW